jgi:glycosyltransferase involved in cell wall biosynthesis
VRIALVGPAHPYKGGGARHTTELAHRLAADGHQVIIESWRAQYPARLYPGQQTVDEPEGEPFPRTYRRLAWYRPDGWYLAGRRLRGADLVVFAFLAPIQAPPYLNILAALGRRRRRHTLVICHNVLPHERRPGDVPLTRALLRRAARALVHSPAQAELARSLAPTLRITVTPMPPHLPHLPSQSRSPSQSPSPCQTPPSHQPHQPHPSSASDGQWMLFTPPRAANGDELGQLLTGTGEKAPDSGEEECGER